MTITWLMVPGRTCSFAHVGSHRLGVWADGSWQIQLEDDEDTVAHGKEPNVETAKFRCVIVYESLVKFIPAEPPRSAWARIRRLKGG